MKIEMGESIVYSWLRHIKECEVVQNNWKTSPCWAKNKAEELQKIKDSVNDIFADEYDVFKRNASIEQIIKQGEADAIGYSFRNKQLFGVDIAFHRNGTVYGSRNETTAKIISKCVRLAMCFLAFFNNTNGYVYFLSPKMGPSVTKDVTSAIQKLQECMNLLGYKYEFKVIVNDDFRDLILNPVVEKSKDIDDTAELFLRSYQLLELYQK